MEEHSNVTIEFQGSEGSEHATKMQLAAQSNTLPDLFYLDIPLAKQMYEQGYLYDWLPKPKKEEYWTVTRMAYWILFMLIPL